MLNTIRAIRILSAQAIVAAGLFVAPTAWAGTLGGITFGPLGTAAATPIPTLGGIMLVLLSLLLAFIAFRSLRGGNGGKVANLLIGALLTGAVVSAGGGVRLIDKAIALPATTLITNPSGQTLPVLPNQVNFYENASGVPQEIRTLTIPTPECEAFESDQEGTVCTVGETLGNGNVCVVDCRDVG